MRVEAPADPPLGLVHDQTRRIDIGDNLPLLAEMPCCSVGLVYLDPPFNSGRTYQNRAIRGAAATDAFQDIWHWNDHSELTLGELDNHVPPLASAMLRALVGQLDKNSLAAYLINIGSRLGHAHRVLTSTGSLYLHVDPAASHYLKVVLDSVFGVKNFRNEITWRRTHAHSGSRRYGPIHDVILFYTKSPSYVWNQQYAPYSTEYAEKYFRGRDERGKYQAITCTGPGDRFGTRAHYEWRGVLPPAGRHWAWVKSEMERLDAAGRLTHSRNGVPRLKVYLNEGPGVRLQDIWTDIQPLSSHASERLGYDTQKPVELLTRIIESSSEPGEIVLDPYCGTGTTAVAAERLRRGWHVMDASTYAGSMTLARTRGEAPTAAISLGGMPASVPAAKDLLRRDPLGYSAWSTALLATQLDRQSNAPELAIGTRNWGRSALGVVPLRATNTRFRRDLSDPYPVCFVVDGPGASRIAADLRRNDRAEVHAVPISSLVSPVVAQTGLAQLDLKLMSR